ncbi:MAG: hypothetical protein WBX23_12085 [Candidatus Cybelea sp.]
MPRACSICTHERTAEITKALTSGDSLRAIAARFEVTTAAAQRHLRNCLRTVRRAEKSAPDETRINAPVSSRFDTLDPSTLVAATARLVDEALDLLEHAKRADDRRTALVALREARDGLALLMKTAGMLAGDASSTTVIDQRRQVVQVLGKLTDDELRVLIAGGTIGAESTLKTVTDNRVLSATQPPPRIPS